MSEKEAFLKELSKISKKYQIYIEGCGCCNSPFLTGEDKSYHNAKRIEWNEEKEQYIEEEYSI